MALGLFLSDSDQPVPLSSAAAKLEEGHDSLAATNSPYYCLS